MALFTDGPISGMEDLAAQDTQLASVASAEGIDVTQKLSVAQDELALELQAILGDGRAAEDAVWRGPGCDSRNVVVTPALRLWHIYRTLETVYRDAYANQLNDRYAAKRDQFRERARWAYEKLLQIGIGIASSPVPKAGTPSAVSTPGNLPSGTYYVATSWVNSHGEEGASSGVATISVDSGSFLVRPPTAPESVGGWNVYAGIAPESLCLQNDAPVSAEQSWTQPDRLETGGRSGCAGQSANYLKAVPRTIQRG